jgi:hypothetical protein
VQVYPVDGGWVPPGACVVAVAQAARIMLEINTKDTILKTRLLMFFLLQEIDKIE